MRDWWEMAGDAYDPPLDSGEGAESPDELVGTEDGCDEDDPDGEDGGEGGSYYSSEAMDAARRID